MTQQELVVATLRKARDTFQSYGDQHCAKSPPQPTKAAVNYAMVAEINATLLAIAAGDTVRPPDAFPAKARLRAFIETLGDREDETFVTYSAMLGDLRALTKDS